MSSDWLSPLSASPASDEGITSSVLAYTRAGREASAFAAAAAKGKRKRALSGTGAVPGVDASGAAAPPAAAAAAPPLAALSDAARAAADALRPTDPAYGDAVLAMCGGPAGAAALDAAFLGGADAPSPSSSGGGGGPEPVAAHLARAFTQWGAALAALQPKCVVGPAGVARGLRVLARYVSARGPGPIAMAEAAAAFWVAVKVEGTRSAVPSRALLARATAVPPSDLSSAEVGLLCAVAFDVFGGDIAAEEGEAAAAGFGGPACAMAF